MEWAHTHGTPRHNGGGPTDPPEVRPGVPMEAAPQPAEGAHWEIPEPQPGVKERIRRAGYRRSTPVVGLPADTHAVSAWVRRQAYAVPEHQARHWAMLMLADRVDVAEDRLGALLARPLEAVGFKAGARSARENPVLFLAGAAVALLVVRRMLR